MISLHFSAHNTTDAFTAVHSNTATHLFLAISRPFVGLLHHLQTETHHTQWRIFEGQRCFSLTGNVGITHSFYLVNFMLVGEFVEEPEELPNELHHFFGTPCAGQSGKSTQVRLGNGGIPVVMGWKCLADAEVAQFLHHHHWHQCVQDRLSALFCEGDIMLCLESLSKADLCAMGHVAVDDADANEDHSALMGHEKVPEEPSTGLQRHDRDCHKDEDQR
mmetsp:Transcript_20732/g.25614  ORF Transcript_20732/g.25614 Transcript_20732/m.25614 type:complete len:219 (+) Transcript_20732:258-914(+)